MFKLKHIVVITLLFVVSVLKAQIKPLNHLPDTMAVCSGDSVLVKFPEEKISKSATFQWTTEYAIIVHAKQLYIKKQGKYLVRISDGKKTYADTTYLKVREKPKLLFRDTTLCNGNVLVLNPKNKLYRYTFNGVESNDNIRIDKPGKYNIKINNKGCSVTDTFKVNMYQGVVPNFGKEYIVCESEPNKVLSVKSTTDTKLYWNTGSNATSISPNKEGWFWVKSSSKNCGTKTDSVYVRYKNCDCEIYIPNSFTPNDDDRNDIFNPVFQCEYSYFALTIYDRWGNIVYNSNNINGKWDGRFKGNPCPDDVYIYHLEAIQKSNDKKVVRKGHISLFR